MVDRSHTRRLRAFGVSLALAFGLIAAIAPAVARAATASVDGAGFLNYVAAAGETNDVTISPIAGGLRVEDTGAAGIIAGSGCSGAGNTVDCLGVTGGVFVDAGDKDDRIVLASNPLPVSTDAILFGGTGGDFMAGAFGNDLLVGCQGGDTLNGGYGNDTLVNGFICPGGGSDSYDGGFGSDTFSPGLTAPGAVEEVTYGVDRASDLRAARWADVTVSIDGKPNDGEFGENDNVMPGIDNITGGKGDDILVGDAEANTLKGLEGADLVDGGLGADLLWLGGDYGDTISYEARTSRVHVDLSSAWDPFASPPVPQDPSNGEDCPGPNCEGDTLFGFSGAAPRAVIGGSGNDELIGDGNDNTFVGGLGADTLIGAGGSDTVSYADRTGPVTVTLGGGDDDGEADENDELSGIENVTGGSAGDELTGDGNANTLVGGGGSDTLDGLGGDDTLDGGSEADVADILDGGLDSDTVSYAERSASVSVTLAGGVDDGEPGENDDLSGVENVTGGDGDDYLTGNGSDNSLNGGPGRDVLAGGLGDDTLIGGSGLLDTATYEGRANNLTVTIDNAAGDGEAGESDNVRTDIEKVIGGDGDDSLSGAFNVANTLVGGPGADTFVGGGGSTTDTVSYEERTDPVTVTLDGVANDGNLDDESGGVRDDLSGIWNVTGGSAGDELTGDGNANTLVGGGGSDTLNGGASADTLIGGAGIDELNGLGGDDTLDGGSEADDLDGGDDTDTVSYASRTDDVNVTLDGVQNDGANCPDAGCENDNLTDIENLTGGQGDDTLTGSAGAEKIIGGPGDDVIDGGLGADRIEGGDGIDVADYSGRVENLVVIVQNASPPGSGEAGENDDVRPDVEDVWGGSGDDELTGSYAPNELRGGLGDDFLNGRGADDVLIGGPGADTMRGSFGSDTASYEDRTDSVYVTLDGVPDDGNLDDESGGVRDEIQADVENVRGGAGADELTGNGDPNTIDGGAGDDTLDGGEGADVIIGGADTDTASYEGRAAPVTVGLGGVAASGQTGEGDKIETDVENVTGGQGNDRITGDEGPNTLDGGPGEDTLSGGAGMDTLNGGQHADLLRGGAGADTVNGEGDGDQLLGGADTDTLNGGGGDDSLDGGLGADVLNGGPGSDSADYPERTRAVTVDPGDGPDDGEAGEGDTVAGDVEGSTGGTGNDTLIGNDQSGTLDGGPGDDLLDGAGGADVMIGGPGSDTASYAGRGVSVAVNLSSPGGDGQAGENDDVRADVERVVGGRSDDSLVGSGAANALDGGPGNDSLSGQGGWDLLQGGPGNDVLAGDGGGDDLRGGDGNDSLSGGEGSDVLSGEGGDDSLSGNGGSDTLNGGPGQDTADYSHRTAPLFLSTDGGPNDGQPGEGDNVREDVENLRSGSGDDQINAQNGAANVIDCGPGEDTATVDAVDSRAGCENVIVASTETLAVEVLTRSARITSKGRVAIRLRCKGSAGRCEGKLTLKTAGRVRVPRKRGRRARRRKLTLGTRSYSIVAGRRKTIRVKVRKTARRAIRRLRKRVRIKATATPKKDPGVAVKPRTVRKTIKVRGSKKKSKRSRRRARR